MESYVFAGIALLILIPILYFLPMGFTFKGKVFVVLASLLIGVFGLISVAIFPVWQTALILLLFVSSLAYLMSKRNQEWMYVPEVDVDPFAIAEEDEAEEIPKHDIKPSYTYIAVSEKNPKGKLEDLAQNQDLGLLEKLVSNDQSTQEKADVSHGEHELEEIVLDIVPHEEKPEDSKQDVELDKPESEEPVAEHTNYFANVDSEIEAFVHNGQEEVADPDIEAIIHKTEEIAEEMETAQNQQEDSLQYISEIEHDIETGELEPNQEASINDVQLPMLNVEEMLESNEEFESKTSIDLEKAPPPLWLNDEFELDEMDLAKNDSVETESVEKGKEKHKPAVEDNTMVKQ
ncbi:hypothetical protein [Bacillus marasmi]|uniref:hypothetical protein n=1 Tax=Bacillus marasmi TaxID=1926279 RepID=UPI0011CC517A|nr:hypothetical protein [Bacillus marasmi]